MKKDNNIKSPKKKGPGRPKGQYASFEEIKFLAKFLKLTNYKQWQKFSSSGQRPDNVPANIQREFKDQYVSDTDFLGHGGRKKTKWMPYPEAKAFVRTLELKNKYEWRKYKKKYKPNIPFDPHLLYKEWESWNEFLGHGKTPHIKYRPYQEALKFVHKLNLKSKSKWLEYARSKEKPIDIPTIPDTHYKEWESWKVWLGKTTDIKLEVHQRTETNIMYLIRDLDDHPHLLIAGMYKHGRELFKAMQLEKRFEIIRMFDCTEEKYELFMNYVRFFGIQKNDSKYAFNNLGELLFLLDNKFEKL